MSKVKAVLIPSLVAVIVAATSFTFMCCSGNTHDVVEPDAGSLSSSDISTDVEIAVSKTLVTTAVEEKTPTAGELSITFVPLSASEVSNVSITETVVPVIVSESVVQTVTLSESVFIITVDPTLSVSSVSTSVVNEVLAPVMSESVVDVATSTVNVSETK